MKSTLHRAGQLGLLARDLAGVRCRQRGPSRDRALRQLVDRLGLMHGLPQKIGQLLAFSELEQSDAAFTSLTEGKPALAGDAALAEIERQLGRPLAACFRSIEHEGISASIGQVHRATLLDGRAVAVKVQYPQVAEHVKFDLRALGWLTAPVGDLRRDFDLAAYRREIGGMLDDELDYCGEALRARQFAAATRDWPDVTIPEIIAPLSGPRVLTMTWLEGARLPQVRRWPERERRQLGNAMTRLFLAGVFQWHSLHADPHPGNYRFLRCGGQPKIGLLDFGCVKSLSPSLVGGLHGLMVDALERRLDAPRAWSHFMTMGFNPVTLSPLRDRLGEVARVLCEPFAGAGAFSAADWNPADRLTAILGPHRMAFRVAGPAEMVFFLRAFQGLIQYLKALAVSVDWRAEFAALVHSPLPLAAPVRSPSADAMKSTTLHIRVSEGDDVRVALSFNAAAVDNLPLLVPLELHDRLRSRAINLPAIASEAGARNYAPGELFSLADGPKSIRVWLE